MDRDLAAVVQQSSQVPHGACWTETDFTQHLLLRDAGVWVARTAERLDAVLCFLWRPDEGVELLHLAATDLAASEKLVTRFLGWSDKQGHGGAIVQVSEYDVSAQLMFQRAGFKHAATYARVEPAVYLLSRPAQVAAPTTVCCS